mgnify:CR=1 FL=1
MEERIPVEAAKTVEYSSLQTNDFDELGEAASGWDLEYCQLSSGPFEGSIEVVQIGSKQVSRERWGRKLRYQGTAPPGTFAFAVPLRQPDTASWVGMPAGRDDIVVQAPDQEAHLVSAETFNMLVFCIPEDEVQSIVATLAGDQDISFRAHDVVALKPDIADSLRQAGNHIIEGSRAPTGHEKQALSQWSDQIVKLLLCEMLESKDNGEILVRPASSVRLVSRATDLVLAEETGCIGLTDICARLGVSLRSLHYAFQDCTGMSPATYLRALRLNLVHRILLRSEPGEILVKQAALDNGFYHLGHFTSQYRSLFGCTPSQTLRS